MLHLKILVVGSQGTGKTTMIHRVTKHPFSVDVNGTTVGLDFGVLRTSGLQVHVFGCPGMRHFNLVRKALSVGSHGVVLVVDSTDTQSVIEGERYLTEIFGANVPPFVVAANKQDQEGALSPQEIQRLLTFDVPVFPTSAISGNGLEAPLRALIQLLLRFGKGRDIAALQHA